MTIIEWFDILMSNNLIKIFSLLWNRNDLLTNDSKYFNNSFEQSFVHKAIVYKNKPKMVDNK